MVFRHVGASDLAQLTLNAARADPGLSAIGEALRALPGEAAAGHLGLFARMLGEIFPQVPPNVRQRFLHGGLRIIGEDHPEAAAATASLAYYRELLDEIELRVGLDGPAEVGHTRPFGAVLALASTSQLLRESGGFSKYLQGQGQNRQAMMGGGPGPNHRDDFAKNIQTALEEHFEIVSLTFHDPAVKPIDLPREGWVETPLAYLVLRAKTPAVDRIPSFQLDMDFQDKPGQVVLPVLSQVVPIDAREAGVPPRPCPELELTFTLDDRDWGEGTLVLDLIARGRGLIPALDDLIDSARPGFALEIGDGTPAVTRFTSDGRTRHPEAECRWQLSYRRGPDTRGELRFPFPALRPGLAAKVTFQHYQDADLATLSPAEAAAGVKLSAPVAAGTRAALLIALALAVPAVVFIIARRLRRRAAAPDTTDELGLPAELTPFSVVAFLRRLRRRHAGRLGPAEHDALAADIARLEAGYFRPGPADPATDPAALARKWLASARPG
jgi:hypothetical protein